jgi:GH15 family glucan-1,4-alpha-glucosidase
VTADAQVTPIGAYGLIGDTRTAGLVGPDGSIDWLCAPRFDSPPIFGRLVGGESAGRFRVAPTRSTGPAARCYRPGTATLDTTWGVGAAQVTLSDSMVGEVSGRLLPATLLVRRVVADGGPVAMTMELEPRFGYGRRPARRVRHHDFAAVFESGALAVGYTSDSVAWSEGPVEFVVEPGRPVTLALSAAAQSPLVFVPAATARREAERDEEGWRTWAADVALGSPYRDAVIRSLLTLRLLTYSPSGAPVAAPTTSLPEVVGGARNWDYRFAWPRDSAIGVAAFLGYGKQREAEAFLAWLLHASRLDRPRLPALFTLDGRRAPPEVSLPGWPGYAASVPVNVGNGAADQHQLDGYGWVIDSAWLAVDAGIALTGEAWRAIVSFADHVVDRWPEPDAGIWERRDDERHHVHSKLMAWLALDRAVRIADRRGGRRAARAAARWSSARDALGAQVRDLGFDGEANSYTAAYGTGEVDAALLVLPLVGIEPPDSLSVSGTIAAVRRQLGAGGPLLYRYLGGDGLPGREGAFLPCSFWLVQALAVAGRRSEARGLFTELLELGGPLGLYAEEMDPTTREHLGNFPQGLTHAALLQAALALERGPRSRTHRRQVADGAVGSPVRQLDAAGRWDRNNHDHRSKNRPSLG